MKYVSFCLVTVVAFLSFSGVGLAHKVNVFAFVDGNEIQVECSFSRSQKVKNGKLAITDLETGDMVLEGVTDERGVFRFRPSADFLQIGHGLNIRLLAGEGHQNDWNVSAEELRTLSAIAPALGVKNEASQKMETARWQSSASPTSYPAAGQAAHKAVLSGIDAEELEALIGNILDAKLAPIRQTLARRQDDEPGFKDIIGGIGWILGLLGLATYMKYRR